MTVEAHVREAIDQIEEAYEFMLAYAAQGRQQESDTEGASQIRRYLERFNSALDTIAAAIPELFRHEESGHAFAERFASDTRVMTAIVDLLASQPRITSDMIDNTNGLIAVRALLTDLFFVDQVVLPPR